MHTNTFHVGHEIWGGVAFQVGVRCRTPRAALIEQDDAIDVGMKEAPVIGLASRAGATVDKQDGQPIGVTALFDVKLVRRVHLQALGGVRFDVGKKFMHVSTYSLMLQPDFIGVKQYLEHDENHDVPLHAQHAAILQQVHRRFGRLVDQREFAFERRVALA